MAIIRLYEELNDFLPVDKRKLDFSLDITETCTVQSILSSLRIPLESVDLILVNSQSVDAGYIIHTDDRISVYPVFERFNIANVTRVRSRPLRRPKFITDAGLEALADQLSALGLDVICNALDTRSGLIKQSKNEKRIILTLDRKILRQRSVARAIVLNAGTIDQMVEELRQRLDL